MKFPQIPETAGLNVQGHDGGVLCSRHITIKSKRNQRFAADPIIQSVMCIKLVNLNTKIKGNEHECI